MLEKYYSKKKSHKIDENNMFDRVAKKAQLIETRANVSNVSAGVGLQSVDLISH